MRADAATTLREYPALTGLRGFAALWVLLYHAWVEAEPRLMTLPLGSSTLNITPAFSMGWFGVDIFFVLSAFLLALPFASAATGQRPAPRLRDYFQRRFLRILPAYYAQLLLVLLFIGWHEQRLGLTPGAIAAHAVLWLNFGPQPVAPLVGVWWTLPIEFGFYLLLPLLAPLLTTRRVPWLIAGAIVVTLAYRYGMFQYASDRSIGEKVLLLEQLPGRLDQFVIGAAAAVWAVHLPDHARATSRWLARGLSLGGVLLVLGLVAMMHGNSMRYWEGHALLFCFHMLASFGIAAFIVGVSSDQLSDWRILRSRPLVFSGTVSYSLYLWHQLIIQWLGKQPWIALPTPYLLPTLLAVGGILAFIVAWLSWRLIERPCLAWGRSALAAARPAGSSAVVSH